MGARRQEDIRLPAGFSPALLFGAYALLCALPIILAVVQAQPTRSFFRELSSGIVMVGYVMALLQFVLSGRFESVSGQVGIDRTMRFHQMVAWLIFALVFFHPILYVMPRLVTDPAGALFSLGRMFSSQSLRTGAIAYLLLLLLVLLGRFRDQLPFRYEVWRLSHGLMAVAIAVLGTHHTLRVGTYSADRWLAAFWFASTILAVLALLHIYVLKPLLQLRQPYRVVSNRKVADRMWEIAIEPERGSAIRFAPGQFVWLNLGHSTFSLTEHPFSISSAPVDRPRVAFTIKESGDFTNDIGSISPGTHAYLDGPHGNFTLAGREAEGVVFIAGGVGFAPIMGMLRQLKAERYPHPLRLIYGNRVEAQILYGEETEALETALDFKVHYVLSEPPEGWTGPVGELTPPIIDRCLASLDGDNWLYFVCGPPPMLTSVERGLIERGVPHTRIISERFKYD